MDGDFVARGSHVNSSCAAIAHTTISISLNRATMEKLHMTPHVVTAQVSECIATVGVQRQYSDKVEARE